MYQTFHKNKRQTYEKSTEQNDQWSKRQNINPDEEYEGEQTVESLFREDRHCQISFSQGARLNNVSKQECMKYCLEEDDCQSVNYKVNRTAPNTGQCNLNIETKYVVGPYFTCNDNISAAWDYYEKIRDYFLIFNKESGRVLKAQDENTVVIAEKSEDECYWFWAGYEIHSKKYPQRVLTANQISPGTNTGEVTLSSPDSNSFQKWSYDENVIKVISDDDQLAAELNVGAGNRVVISAPEHASVKYWALSLSRNYFLITNRGSGNVLDAHAADNGQVILWEYHGGDNQLWFWDDDNIRSKKFPDKVLEVDRGQGGFDYGNANLRTFVYGNYLQKWTAPDNQDIIEGVRRPRRRDSPPTICAENFSTANGTQIIGCPVHGQRNDKWTFSASRVYFFIINKISGKVISANTASSVQMEHYDMSKKQLWFWDGEAIRSKRYINKVLAMGSGNRVSLESFQGTPQQNWTYENNFITNSNGNKKIQESGSSVVGVSSSNQKWSITISHDFFTLWNRFYGTALDVIHNRDVITWPYHGQENQRYFWDDRNLRSKRYPNQVLDIKAGSGNRLEVYFTGYNGSPSQNWRHVRDEVISDKQSRKLSLKNYVNKEAHRRVIACATCDSTENVKWGYSSQKIIYFGIHDTQNEKVLVLDTSASNRLRLETQQNGESKYWFWEGSSIRSKMDTKYILTLKKRSGNWYDLTADTFKDPVTPNFVQLFAYDKNQNIYGQLEGFQIEYRNNIIGGFAIQGRKTGNERLRMFAPQEVEEEPESCVNETEAKIYSVIEWIPFLSTLWDLFSSIGYAIAGCESVAQERAINLAIGVVTDVATAFTFGTASAPLAVLKTGIKVGVKLGLKAGLKATVTVAKTSIKKAITKLVSQGFKTTLKKAITKAGKLIVRETIIDPALFLKNVGKFSKQILLKPKRTFLNIVQAGKDGITKLKTLKRKLLREGEITDICTRSLGCASNVTEEDVAEAKKLFDSLESNAPAEEQVKDAAACYLLLKNAQTISTGGEEVPDLANDYKTFKTQVLKLQDNAPDTLVMKEMFAVYHYKDRSDINDFVTDIYHPNEKREYGISLQTKSTEELIGTPKELLQEHEAQAVLLQSYLKKHAIKEPLTVYRWEPESLDRFKKGKTYVETSFMSASKSKDHQIRTLGTEGTVEQRPRVIEIRLKKSGSDISSINRACKNQEILIPFGTHFRVKSKEKTIEEGTNVVKVVLEEV